MPRATLMGLLICLTLTACAENSQNPSDAEVRSEAPQTATESFPELEMCSQNQRPEVCAQFYKPVCGRLEENPDTTPPESQHEKQWKTYGNACSACADHRVIGHKAGACDKAGDA